MKIITYIASTVASHLKNTASKTLAALAAVCVAVGLAGCSDSDETEFHSATLYDIVELTSQSGSGTVFTLWRPDAKVPVTLTCSGPVVDPEIVAEGESLFLAYKPADGKAYTSGPVDVLAYGTVNNAPLMKSTAQSLEGWDAEPVYLMSLWRAGNRVCMRLRMTYDEEPRMFALVVDESTAADEYPTAYLYHRRPSAEPNFSRQYYAAFDLARLWATPGCKGLNIRVNNSNNPELNTFVMNNPDPVEASEQ